MKALCLSLAALALCGHWTQCWAQGTITYTFDGSPIQAPGTAQFVQQYWESGMWFRPLGVVGPGNGFVRRGSNPIPGWPDDGSAYIQAGAGDSLVFSRGAAEFCVKSTQNA